MKLQTQVGVVGTAPITNQGFRRTPIPDGKITRASYNKLGQTVDNAIKSRGPTNGQDALDWSIQVKDTSTRRAGIDYEARDFVVFEKTVQGTFHGHVRTWEQLHIDMQNALRRAGMVDRRGNIPSETGGNL